MSPVEIKGVMFGIDPLSDSGGWGQYVTEHAFVLDVPDESFDEIECSFPSSSTKGLQFLSAIHFNNEVQFDIQFTQKYNIAVINALSNNQ